MYISVQIGESLMTTITFTDFRNRASDILTAVERGATITILRHGRPIAEVIPATASPLGNVAAPKHQRRGLAAAIAEERKHEVVLDSSAFAKRFIEDRESAGKTCAQADALGLCVLCVPEIISALNRRRRESHARQNIPRQTAVSPGRAMPTSSTHPRSSQASIGLHNNPATLMPASPALCLGS